MPDESNPTEWVVIPWVGLILYPVILPAIFFWPRRVACGILVPWPGIEPGPISERAES